jgi:SAM-dependent methyltransferase
MNVFGTYSKYYNLLYKDKNYKEEADYIHSIIQKYSQHAFSILELGCGTGRHAFELAELGYQIHGIDISPRMLEYAHHSLETCNSKAKERISFSKNDIRTFRFNRKFDVVASLFHVMSYQVTDESLDKVFETAAVHLKPGGIFIFDCWYGPAVLTDPPTVRVKEIEDENTSVTRIAKPELLVNENTVKVNYRILMHDKNSGQFDELEELHEMRYLFMPEIRKLSKKHNFNILSSEEYLTANPPSKNTWYICYALIAE